MKKKIFLILTTMLMLFSIVLPVNVFADDITQDVEEPVLINGMSVNITSKKVEVGTSYTLKVTLKKNDTSYNGTAEDIQYVSSNTSVATVTKSGVVTAKKPGSVDIKINTKDGSNLSVVSKLTVIPCKVSGLKLKEGINNVRVYFNKTKGAAVYYIYRSTKKSSGYKLIAKIKGTYYRDNLKNKKARYYYYKVKAVNGSYYGYASNAVKKKARHFIKIKVKCTAYCGCRRCCGKSNCITASGRKAKPYRTIAAWRGLKFGTNVYFPKYKKCKNKGIFVVEDRGGAITSKRIDIYFSSHSKAIQFGRRTLIAYIVRYLLTK